MNRVGIVGAYTTDCRGRYVEATPRRLFQMAVQGVLKDARMRIIDFDSVVYGIYNDIFVRQAIPESFITDAIGMCERPGLRVTNGGATGAYAMRAAYMEVASGAAECVLCIGGEKATDCYDPFSKTATPAVVNTIAYSWDPFFENPLGVTASSSYMQMCMAYNDRYPGDLDPDVRAQMVEMLCRQGNLNPVAQRRDEHVTAEQVKRSRWIIAPFLRLLESCMYTEGAAALVIASEKKAREISARTGNPIIWIRGVGAANEGYFTGVGGQYKPLDSIVSDRLAAMAALRMAGLVPDDIGVVEVHDAFVAQLMITLGEMGFVPRGQTRELITKGIMADIRKLGLDQPPPKGQILVNPSGGLIFGGHFVGGSNMMSCWSARREMIRRHIPFGMIHGTGAINACYGVVFVLELDEERRAA